MSSTLIAILPLLGALLGAYVVHALTKRRDQSNTLKQLRTEHLLDALRKLERGALPPSKTYSKGDFESAIADIQILGSAEQVKLAHRFCESAASGNGRLLPELLESLRRDLRVELGVRLEELPQFRPFRING